MFASSEVFIDRMVLTRERALASFCSAPIGASELFLRFPRAARCRRGRRHRSALGSIVSARWAGRAVPSHVRKHGLKGLIEFSPSQPCPPNSGNVNTMIACIHSLAEPKRLPLSSFRPRIAHDELTAHGDSSQRLRSRRPKEFGGALDRWRRKAFWLATFLAIRIRKPRFPLRHR